MNRLSGVIVMAIFLLPAGLRAQELSLSLQEAVAIGLRDNRDILLKAEEVEKAKAKIAEANAGLFPTLDFTGELTYTRGLYTKDLTQTNSQATLKQYLYKGGETVNTIRKTRYDLEVSRALLDKEKLQAVLDIEKAFYTLILSRELSDLNKGIVENTRAHLNFIETRYANGQASESDILAVKESLSSVEEAYVLSLNQTESSASLLGNLLYLEETIKINPEGGLAYQPRDVLYEEGFLKAMQDRPEIKQYQAQQEADKKAVEIAKAGNRPDIYASWDYYSRSHKVTVTVNTKDWNDYNVAGLTFSWPVFDGWQTKAKVEQALSDLKQTRLARDKALKDIALEVKDAYLALKDAISKIKAAESEVVLYKDNLEAAKQKYKEGIASALDLDDSFLKYGISEFSRKQAAYDYLMAQAGFDKATGGLR